MYVVRDKQEGALKEAKIYLAEGLDMIGRFSAKIVVETDLDRKDYMTFVEFFNDWEIIGELK